MKEYALANNGKDNAKALIYLPLYCQNMILGFLSSALGSWKFMAI